MQRGQVPLLEQAALADGSPSSVRRKCNFPTIFVVLLLLTVLFYVVYSTGVTGISTIFSPILNRNSAALVDGLEYVNAEQRVNSTLLTDAILSTTTHRNRNTSSLAPIQTTTASITSSSTRTYQKPKILFWTTFFSNQHFYTALGDEYYRNIQCPFICEHTASKDEWSSSDALIFHVRDNYIPLPSGRLKHQKWIYFIMESPVHTYPKDETIDKLFNWTMTFNRHSDIWHPYGRYRRRQQSVPTKPVSIEGKKLAAWLVSNCGTDSKREILYHKLSGYIKIDQYGACGEQGCSSDRNECYSQFGKEYLFYLSWENSLCEDYITEKLWLALAAGMVPIVYGGSQYDQLLPPHSFIDVTSFNSIKDLADYIEMLSTNLTAYQEYHRWNELYQIEQDDSGASWCDLCEKLYREQDNPTTTNVKISEFWSTEKLCSKKDADKNRLINNP